ncbi:MAG: right-handed parallel beta-helix repeat-containing protein, partial [Clostridiales bacterium]|nr:right-handed parallel beta-helix repeat-containing protein [Clostridiales bacterium]
MKRRIKSLLITAITTCFAISVIPSIALASDQEAPTLPTDWNDLGYEKVRQYTIEDLNGDSIDATDIQYGLDLALAIDDVELLEVTIPSGDYTLDWPLTICSNTHLILEEGTTLKRSDNWQGGEMLLGRTKGSTDASVGQGGEYSAICNVFVDGGTWDANKNLASSDYSNVITIVHGENLVFKNITIKNAVDHMINISGTNKVLVEGCSFSDSQIYTGTDEAFYTAGNDEEAKIARHNPIEAIHLDFMNAAGESGVLDGTPCQNITIRNCTFNNVFRGIGTHHTISSSPNAEDYATGYADKIAVENNTFNNVRAACVSGYSFKNMTIKNNTVTNVGCFCEFIDAHDSLVSSNTITGSANPTEYEKYVNILPPLFIQSCSRITISGNSITSDDKIHSNIMITESSSDIAIDSNELSGAKTTCIYAKDSDNIVVNNTSEEKKNTYSTNGENELYVENTSVIVGYDTFNKNICVTESSATISNCTLNGGYILLSKANKITIEDSTINTTDSNITACILIMECKDDITISKNTLSTAGNNCIYMDNTVRHNVKISGNTFVKSSKYLVYIANSNTVTVSDNVMSNTTNQYDMAINVNNSEVDINNNNI